MHPLSQLLLSAGATVLAFGLWKLAGLIYLHYKSPVRMIPGPKSSHWLYGNFKEIIHAVSKVLSLPATCVLTPFIQENSIVHERWVEEYGPTFKYYGFLNVRELVP